MATEMTAIEKAKWFVVLKMFNETFDPSYLKSVTASDTPTPKQMDGLARCVTGLRRVSSVVSVLTLSVMWCLMKPRKGFGLWKSLRNTLVFVFQS